MIAGDLIAYDLMPAITWNKLAQAANDTQHALRLMAVATVDAHGKPSNRLLVLRGADLESGRIWFHTDRRSPKIRHLKAWPYVSVLAYDSQDCIQIRLDGRATLHFDDSLAQDHWEQISLAVQYAYALPHGPSEPIDGEAFRHEPDQSLRHADPRLHSMHLAHREGHLQRGRQNFVVIQVQVETIDWLQVTSTGQRRAIMRADAGWAAQPLTP
jgi:pyridoxamine 5'-phosphate oxidase